MQGCNAEVTAVTETPLPSTIQLTVVQPLEGKNVQAPQNGYVTATRGRGVAMDEEKDQRDCSHPRPLSDRADEARRLELRAYGVNGILEWCKRCSRKRGMAYGGDTWEKCGGG